MVIYKCNICSKEFTQKSNYNYHKNRKNPCQKTEPVCSQNRAENEPTYDRKKEYKIKQITNILEPNKKSIPVHIVIIYLHIKTAWHDI